MKNCLVVLGLLFALFSRVNAQHYVPVEQSSLIQFKVSHQMIFKSTVTGTFTGLKGTIAFDPENLAGSVFNVSVDAKTISTGIGLRDNDLRKDKYFDVVQYPLITIKSKTITKTDRENEYIFSGMLEMKGSSKPISFPFTAIQQNNGYVFKGHFQINRLEYSIGPDNSIDKDVIVDLSVTAK